MKRYRQHSWFEYWTNHLWFRRVEPPPEPLPKWLILICFAALLPVYLLRGAAFGVIDYFFWWRLEFKEILETEDEQ
jgi:hypothetical protein